MEPDMDAGRFVTAVKPQLFGGVELLPLSTAIYSKVTEAVGDSDLVTV